MICFCVGLFHTSFRLMKYPFTQTAHVFSNLQSLDVRHSIILLIQCSHTIPKMKFPIFALLFPNFMTHSPYQFCMKLCEIILLTENISKYWIQEAIVF